MRTTPILALVALAACGVGPRRLETDRISYTEAIAESWKRQLLLNIVRLRYMDAPVFLDVEQILAGYTMESTATAGWSQGGVAEGWSAGAGGRFTDRPTITYRPVSGAEFAKSFMTPIPPSAVIYLMQAGFSADYLFPLCVQSINGLRNYSGGKSMQGKADDRFVRLVEALTKAQRTGALGLRVEQSGKATTTVLVFPKRDPDSEADALVKEIAELLRLEPGGSEFQMEYSTAPGGGDKVVMLTRSAFAILFELAVQIDVPEDHRKKGYAAPAPAVDESIRLIRVHTGTSNPGDDAFVAVQHEGHWFWIRKDDLAAKRTFSFVRLLFGFVDKGASPPPTLVTVPSG